VLFDSEPAARPSATLLCSPPSSCLFARLLISVPRPLLPPPRSSALFLWIAPLLVPQGQSPCALELGPAVLASSCSHLTVAVRCCLLQPEASALAPSFWFCHPSDFFFPVVAAGSWRRLPSPSSSRTARDGPTVHSCAARRVCARCSSDPRILFRRCSLLSTHRHQAHSTAACVGCPPGPLLPRPAAPAAARVPPPVLQRAASFSRTGPLWPPFSSLPASFRLPLR
jgi:hypothetical protein